MVNSGLFAPKQEGSAIAVIRREHTDLEGRSTSCRSVASKKDGEIKVFKSHNSVKLGKRIKLIEN